MDYWRLFQRNIGVFTREQQRKLQNAKIFVAGVGGVGGIEAATLARFGVGELVIMDPGFFDEPDMNRQYAAMGSTLGCNKARATARVLRDINPCLRLTVLERAVEDPAELADHMADCALVIDAIDYAGFAYKAMFARCARELGLFNLTAPLAGFGTLLVIFDPQGMALERFYRAPADPAQWSGFSIPLDRLLGDRRFGHIFRDYRERERDYIATCAGAAALNGGLVATEAALIVAGLRPRPEIVAAPRVTYIDVLGRTFEVYDADAEAEICQMGHRQI